MNDAWPNVLLLMVDQMRADCLGIAGHPIIQTPHLDHLAATGTRFECAYSACPICIPARRTLMTGRSAAAHGVLCNRHVPLLHPTLPQAFADAGYQTHLVGKLHLHPLRKRYGFHSADWSDSPRSTNDDDYQRFLQRHAADAQFISDAHGVGNNSWIARPWPLDNRLHFSHWCAESAINYLERRDPTLPFFLNVSFYHPHQPLTPPREHFEYYLRQPLPPPIDAAWSRVFDGPQHGLDTESWRVCLDENTMHQMRAAYYALITDIDDQIGRLLQRIPPDTWIVFVSDHGEMLGDHQWIRKRNALEGSARVPLIIRPPASESAYPCGQLRREPVELMDLMPTLLDAIGRTPPNTIEGRSLLSLMTGTSGWRKWLHGECCNVPTLNSGMQFLTDGKYKYIWYPGRGEEQFFDLDNDPDETTNLALSASDRDLSLWRERLVQRLVDRPEGFTDGRSLLRLDGPTPGVIEPQTTCEDQG